MFCIYCGAEIPDDAVFCKSCGKKQPPDDPKEATIIIEDDIQQIPDDEERAISDAHIEDDDENTEYEDDITSEEDIAPTSSNSDRPTYNNDPFIGLKWHYFITNFVLWAWMLFWGIGGITAIIGIINGETTATTSNMIFSVCFVVVSFGFVYYVFITRKALVNFNERGPQMLIICHLIVIAIVAIEYFLFGLSDYMKTIAVMAGFLLVNWYYYRKRSHLFRY